MFVKIENTNESATAVLDWLQRSRNANGGVISPEIAMELLKKTNFYGHIKVVLKNIDKMPDKEKIKYKDFVLSAIDEREQKGEALKGLRALADVCGVRDEFETLNKKLKFYSRTECSISYVTVKTKKEFEALKGKFLRVIFDNSDNDDLNDNLEYLDGCDFTGIKELKFAPGSTALFEYGAKMPKIIDVSKCLWVRFEETDLSRVEELKLGDCVSVVFECCENLPKNLDVSMCSTIEINNCDLRDIKELKFKDGAEVSLRGSYLSKVLNVSNCSEVDMEDCDFISVKQVKFKNKAQREEIRDKVYNFNAKVVYAERNRAKSSGSMEL
jgi:hypothetical protein